jgi:outer membrane receptor for ferrienterochelin and colicin
MKNILTLILLTLTLSVFSQLSPGKGAISGKITDLKSGEELTGAVVTIVNTPLGAAADVEGNYQIKNINPGTYNLICKSLGYEPKKIEGVIVKAGEITQVAISMEEPKSNLLSGVTVEAERKKEGEKSVQNEVRKSNNVVSAISGEQIQKSQDKDASEIVKRIPGVTVVDNRFIMVRGLSDRYNSVFLNDVGTPSSETDKKSFSFDVIPSAYIERILIYKTPSPELPGDFAGGMVKIYTKSTMPKSKLSISFAGNFRQGSTGNTFYNSAFKSSTDFLGFDNGSRKIPLGSILEHTPNERKADAALFNNTWGTTKQNAPLDFKIGAVYANEIKFKNHKFTTISIVNYSNAYTTLRIRRRDIDPDKDVIDTQSTAVVRLSAMQNFNFTINENNKIGLKFFINQMGRTQTTIRNSILAEGPSERSYAMGYQSRGIFCSQLNGEHKNKKETLSYNWTLGYSYNNKNEPDLKRIKYTKQQTDNDSMYYAAIPSGSASPEFGVRFYAKLDENIYSFNHQVNYTAPILKRDVVFSLGNYVEYKNRVYDARLLGYTINPSAEAFVLRRMPVDRIFAAENITNPQGFSIDEITEPNYHYTGTNKLLATFLMANIPLTDKLKLVGGVRHEYDIQTLNSYLDQTPITPSITTSYILPSANASYNITAKKLIRAAYGKTLNRPEFREWSPFKFYDFDYGSDVYGSLFKTVLTGSGEVLKTTTIQNFDLRYEYYPSNSEYIHVGVFYKTFTNPIEQYILPGANRIFTYGNAASAYTRGLELDIRKSLAFADTMFNTKAFGNFAILFNTSLIQSQISYDYSFGEALKRPLQGQSPYVVNAGIYYQNDKIGLQMTALYNIIGPRIFLVGSQDYPSWGELPRQLLDISIAKKIGGHFSATVACQDVLNQSAVIVQDTNMNGKFDAAESDLKIVDYKRGRYFSLGIKYDL